MSNKEVTKEERTVDDTTKPRTMRLTDETFEYIKKLAAQLGGNQQHAVSELLRVYEGQIEKDALPAGAEQLEEFEKYQARMHDIFMDLIRSRNDAADLARVDYAKQLDTKDEIICELQKNLKDIKAGEDGATEKAESLRKENDELKQKMQDEIEHLKGELKKSKEECGELKEQVSSIKEELAEAKKNESDIRKLYDERVASSVKLMDEVEELKNKENPLRENISKVASENRVLLAENARLTQENKSLRDDIESLKTTHTAEIKLITANTELKAKNDAYKELLAEKDRYSQLIEKIKYDRTEKILDNLKSDK
ncbi:hypothetical protein [Butyrivibrio sp. M55]|uniref:hypothetical protein n=1 Tax=Butyrivibrio sp. M55 TaxID=1855323 RepID=UPI0008EB66ED|nr:hypothetical protein [Butyrivibrio sp. M55]SFU33672.1 hypothetical protein SAMN05216540_101147 [Butyrivibrio sp. M55]